MHALCYLFLLLISHWSMIFPAVPNIHARSLHEMRVDYRRSCDEISRLASDMSKHFMRDIVMPMVSGDSLLSLNDAANIIVKKTQLAGQHYQGELLMGKKGQEGPPEGIDDHQLEYQEHLRQESRKLAGKLERKFLRKVFRAMEIRASLYNATVQSIVCAILDRAGRLSGNPSMPEGFLPQIFSKNL